jgi:CHAT domain-containing protein
VDQPREPGANACPAVEDVAAYLDGQLSPQERAAVQAHIADCDACRELLVEVRGTLDALPADSPAVLPPPVAPPVVLTHRRPLWKWAVPIAAAAAILIVALRVYAPGPGVAPELQAIVAAAGTYRPTTARLTGGFAYAAPATPLRSGDAARELSPDLRIAIAQAEKDAAAERTPARLHALGVAMILDAKHDAAIAALEDAAAQAPQDAAVLSDLAAAYLARARSSNQADDLARGLDAVERSIRAARGQAQDPPLEALFNRALLLESLSLRGQARDAWSEYLSRDGASAWAAEARDHQQQLGSSSRREEGAPIQEQLARLKSGADVPREMIDRFAQNLREYAQSQLVQWAERTHRSETSPPDALARVSAFADALARATTDRLLAEAVARLDRTDRARQIEGLARYADARRASERFEFAAARPIYQHAAALLGAARNPMELWARFFAAQAVYYARDLDTADAELAAIDRVAEGAGYLALQGRVRWLRGLILIDKGRFAAGEREYRAAIERFERGREWDNAANVQSLIADSARSMADYRASWNDRLPVLERVTLMSDPSRMAGALLSTALLAESQGLQHAAIVFQDAAADALRQQASAPAAHVQVLLRRAASLRAVDDTVRATEDLEAARALLPKVADSGVSRRLEAERLSIAADLHDPATAERELTSAIDLSTQAGLTNRLPPLLLKRARVRRVLGNADAARADLLEGIKIFERGRGFTPGVDQRVSYFDKSWVLFSELVDLARDQGDMDAAFQFSERGRGRWLRDQLQPQDAAGLDRAHLRTQLTGDTRVVYFTVLPRHVLTWILWRDGEHLAVTAANGAEIAALAQQFSSLLDSGWPSQALSSLSARLYETLIRPVQAHLPAGAPLIVVPDPQIATVPFAALRGADGRYLVERHAIGYAPTGHVLMTALDAASTRMPGAVLRVSVLATGGSPRAALLASQREVDAIAQWMPGSRVWSGAEATAAHFREALAEDDVVHFSGHAVANPEFPGLSRLEFEADGGSSRLLAGDLPSGTRARLVVLAACSTAAGAVSRGEGVMGLARPIMAAGVPTVVATLWDVEDAAAAAVFAEFYRALAQGDDSLRALQRAQTLVMRETDPERRDPRRWAAFANMGAPFAQMSPREAPSSPQAHHHSGRLSRADGRVARARAGSGHPQNPVRARG